MATSDLRSSPSPKKTILWIALGLIVIGVSAFVVMKPRHSTTAASEAGVSTTTAMENDKGTATDKDSTGANEHRGLQNPDTTRFGGKIAEPPPAPETTGKD